jgi:hypothetical protein
LAAVWKVKNYFVLSHNRILRFKSTNMKPTPPNKRPLWFWFKQPAIYPPSILLFFALFGLIYLLSYDKLLTLYALPFFLLFAVGIFWLRAVKRYIERKD